MDLPAIIEEVIKSIQDKKGYDIVVLNVKGLSPITDYFIIATVDSDAQALAVVDEIEKNIIERFGKIGFKTDGISNYDGWAVLDFYDFMVHIFSEEKREYYNLERLWNSAEKIEIPNIDFINISNNE